MIEKHKFILVEIDDELIENRKLSKEIMRKYSRKKNIGLICFQKSIKTFLFSLLGLIKLKLKQEKQLLHQEQIFMKNFLIY